MTQGRFETIYNCRPDGWDDRNFWTKHRTKGLAVLRGPHEKDHMERESCPFHDLRAEGCFQPEYWGPGVMSRTIDPAHLTGRGKGGRLLRTGVWRPHKGVGCGGTLIPEDTAPGQPPKLLLRGQQDRPWTSTGAKRAAFSIPPYMTVPPAAPLVPPVEASFHTNFHVQYPYVPYEHQADEYVPATSQGRIDFRLKAGKVPFRLDPRLKFEPGPQCEMKKKKKRPIPRDMYTSRGTLQGTFGVFPEYHPTPYTYGTLKTKRRPLFTWFTHTKRSMPVAVPWTTGLTTAEPTHARPQSCKQ